MFSWKLTANDSHMSPLYTRKFIGNKTPPGKDGEGGGGGRKVQLTSENKNFIYIFNHNRLKNIFEIMSP